MKRILTALVSAWCVCAFADADADLRAAHARERAGQKTEAAAGYAGVYANDKLPKHQRLAALCGLLRTDDARRASLGRDALKSSDAEWSGTAAQAIALLPAPALDAVRATWLKELPGDAQVKLVTALAHVKSPAAKGYIQEILKKTAFPAVRLAALEGLGRTGGADDAKRLVIWMHSEDPEVAAAARRGLILLTDARANRVLADELKNYGKDPAFLAKLLDVLTVRNPLGLGGAIAPFLAHADAGVRVQAYKALALQGMAPEMPAVLAAAGKATDKKERKEARRAVARIARRMGGVQFKARRIGNCRTEACGVADFNNDGKLDVIAGPYLYLAPDFKARKVREVKSDVKEDGTKETWWIENLLPTDAIWTQHLIEQTGNIETGILVDIDGDGKATDFLPDTQVTCLYQLGKGGPAPFTRDSVSNDRCDMGRGCGDVNGDGRNDVLTPVAWYEHLADGGWKKHPLNIGFQGGKLGHASNLIVFDVNKDGLADIIVSSAHKYGIFWWEQLKERDAAGEIQFRKHVIDDTWTQAHYLGWGDIDNDGVPEIVTGKRFMAHNGGDPDEYGPLGIYYYDFTPGPNPVFKKYVISYDSDISVGLNVECVDLDGDGDLDLVTTGKYGGPVILENKLK